jgi:hypothetical protein
MLREADSLSYGGCRNEFDGSSTVFFCVNGTDYEYDMDRRDAETVNWLWKKSSWKALNLVKKRCWKWRKIVKTQVARELQLIAKALTAGDRLLATNSSSWSWEDDADTVSAFLYVDAKNVLTLRLDRTHTKYGIGAGVRTAVVFEEEVGTLDTPKINKIRSVLKQFGHERTRSGSPFKRLWRNEANKQDMELGTIIADDLAAVVDKYLESQPPVKSGLREKLIQFVSKASESDIEWMVNTLDLHL